jgi:hypothetical protein
MLPEGNYLFAEKVIVDRLKSKIPDVYISGIGTTDDLKTSKHQFPGIFILYAGDEISDKHVGNGKGSQAFQHWIVSVAAKSTEDLSTGTKVREIAGKIFHDMLVALQGFEVLPGRPLIRTDTPLPIAYINGHIYAAASFLLTIEIVGGPN